MQTISSALFPPSLLACFTTRHGGVSKYPFAGNNLAFHVEDDPADVLQNHDLLSQHLDYQRSHLVHMRQIHSDIITVVKDDMHFEAPPECDALITNRPNIPLMVMSADCTPILLHDSVKSVIACVHAGREGALKHILPKTIHQMIAEYGCDIRELRISLGPSIHGCCYEINDKIAHDVVEKGYMSALRSEENRVFLDVNTILLIQLDALGVKKEHIEVIDECTSCHHDTYFSYRANAKKTGRIAGIIMLR